MISKRWPHLNSIRNPDDLLNHDFVESQQIWTRVDRCGLKDHEWSVDFLQNNSLSIQHTHSSKFSISTSTSKIPSLDIVLWSYASYKAQCGMITSHSTSCGYFVRDYHINFRPFALSNPSVPTLCLKDPRSGVDTIQPDFLLTAR